MMLVSIWVLFQVTTDRGPVKYRSYVRDTEEMREFFAQVPGMK
jgi:hypothetical protein